jgi:hypothetical protein
MTSSIKTELHLYVWNEGEMPIDVSIEDDGDEYALQRQIGEQLDKYDFAKFQRIFPSNTHMDGDELTILYRAFTDPYRGRIAVSGLDEAELAQAYAEQKAFCEQKVFTPAELYALKPTNVTHDSYHTVSVHLPEVDVYNIDLDAVGETKRFETRTLVDYDYDGRRGWTLQTVWYDGKPVMVVNSSGRDGEEYHDRWITDNQAFGDMIGFLRSYGKDDHPPSDFAKASDVIPAMTEFYGHTIHDYYDVESQESRKA